MTELELLALVRGALISGYQIGYDDGLTGAPPIPPDELRQSADELLALWRGDPAMAALARLTLKDD